MLTSSWQLIFALLDNDISETELKQKDCVVNFGSNMFYREFRTIRIGGVRQTGKTTWLKSFLKQRNDAVGLFRDRVSVEHIATTSSLKTRSFYTYDAILTYLINTQTVQYIVIDDASFSQSGYEYLINRLVEANLPIKPRIVCLG